MKRTVVFPMILAAIICLANHCSKNPGIGNSSPSPAGGPAGDTAAVDMSVKSFSP